MSITDLPPDDRRRETRIACRATFGAEFDKQVLTVEVIDISRDGARLIVPVHVEPGQVFTLNTAGDKEPEQRVDAHGVVRHSTPLEDGRYCVGCEMYDGLPGE